MKKSESISKLAPALIAFNSQIHKIAKDAANPFHKNKYATLDQIVETIRPILADNKLAVMQNVSGQDGFTTVTTTLIHESGEWMESSGTTLKLAKNDPQGAGAGVTYGRRYDLCAFLSLNTGDDDDGNSASGIRKDAITQKQVGTIKAKAMKFAKARGGNLQDVYAALKFDDITKLSKKQAESVEKQLDAWLAKVDDTNA